MNNGFSPSSRLGYFNALVLLISFVSSSCVAFQFPPLIASFSADSPEKKASPKRVAVAGATGRTGKLVVQKILERNKSNSNSNVHVVALVRDLAKAKETLPSDDSNISVVQCDLSSPRDIQKAVSDCDAAIWCATGFSSAPQSSIFDKIMQALRLTLAPKESIDLIAIPTLAEIFLKKGTTSSEDDALPKVIMLSSAGVTRPKWSKEKKKTFEGCADIPIVRLNPFGILDIKAESEEKLRQSGVNYCIFRPCGLNNDWPSGSRPIFSQGDVAVGRIHRDDAASILVEALYCTEAVGKTFEAFTIKGYPPARSIRSALQRLRLDSDVVDESCLRETYSLVQQLLPGEVQEPSMLAAGQTYEELDSNKVGKFGKRGEENAEAIFPRPSA